MDRVWRFGDGSTARLAQGQIIATASGGAAAFAVNTTKQAAALLSVSNKAAFFEISLDSLLVLDHEMQKRLRRTI